MNKFQHSAHPVPLIGERCVKRHMVLQSPDNLSMKEVQLIYVRIDLMFVRIYSYYSSVFSLVHYNSRPSLILSIYNYWKRFSDRSFIIPRLLIKRPKQKAADSCLRSIGIHWYNTLHFFL